MPAGAIGAAYLPLFVIANIAVTIAVGLFLRTYAAGKWTASQEQGREQNDQQIKRLTGLVENLAMRVGDTQTDVAVIKSRLSHLERGGAGRN